MMKISSLFRVKPHYTDNHTFYFVNHQETKLFSEQRDVIDIFKNRAKKLLGPFYTICIYLFSPVMPRVHFRTKQLYINFVIDEYISKKNSFCLQVGSGVSKERKNVVNLDIFYYEGVNVVASATDLPFKNNCFSSYLSIAVLEHIQNPELMIAEANRVLKKGGIIITGAPFIQGFHASPHDYTRWTHAGMTSIHERHGFDTISVIPICGPASALTWILVDFFSILFSFGSRKIFYVLFMLFSLIFIPLKFIDLLLINYSESYRISSFFLYVGKKK